MGVGCELCGLRSAVVSCANSRPLFLTSGGFVGTSAAVTLKRLKHCLAAGFFWRVRGCLKVKGSLQYHNCRHYDVSMVLIL